MEGNEAQSGWNIGKLVGDVLEQAAVPGSGEAPPAAGAPSPEPAAPAPAPPETPGTPEAGASDLDRLAPPPDVFKPKAPPAPPESALSDESLLEGAPTPVLRDKKQLTTWTGLKREIKSLEQQLVERDRQIQELSSRANATPTVSSDELAALQAKVSEYETRIGQLDVSQSKEFREKYDRNLDGMFARGVALMERAGVERELAIERMKGVLAAPSMDGVQDLLGDLPLPVQGAVLNLHTDMQSLQEARTAAINSWRETQAALKEDAVRTQTAELTRRMDEGLATAVNEVREEGSWLFKASGTNPDWDAKVNDRIAAVRGILRASDPKTVAKYVAEGVAARTYRELYETAMTELVKVRSELGAVTQATPSVGVRGPAPVGMVKPAVARSVDEFFDRELR